MTLDHTRAPLAEGIRAYRDAGAVPFTTPGHKRGRGIPAETIDMLGQAVFENDIPVASGVDDTHMTHGVLRQAEELAADAYGADRSFFLVNGSTIGNEAAIMAVTGPGDSVIVARNFHKSMLAALVLSGARPIYVNPRLDAELEIVLGIDAADLAGALAANPSARAVLVVNPSYFGLSADLRALSHHCHERGVPLIVDEAWGPHFVFHPDLPLSAMAADADAAVTSIHKVLTGFTQSSILNLRGSRIDAARVAACLDMLHTTSPSALILASIDACRRQMVLSGRDLLGRTLLLAAVVRQAIAAIPGLACLGAKPLGRRDAWSIDPTKLVIDVHNIGTTGYDADVWLRRHHNITVEMSDHRRVVALLSIADDEASAGRLVTALREMAGDGSLVRRLALTPTYDPRAVQTRNELTPREAFFAPWRAVPLAGAPGRIAAEVITPYPPGIPLLAPGDRITGPIVEYLQAGTATGMHVTGAADPTLASLRVVA